MKISFFPQKIYFRNKFWKQVFNISVGTNISKIGIKVTLGKLALKIFFYDRINLKIILQMIFENNFLK